MSRRFRLGLPSKGRLQQDTLDFLQACDVKVSQSNARQYIAQIKSLPQLEVWFQRPVDVARQVRDGVMEIGITGYDILAEHRGDPRQTIIVHDALAYGNCTLELIVPRQMAEIETAADLGTLARTRPADRPLRVATKFERITTHFLEEQGITPYQIVRADGALEAAPHMGTAEVIVDLVQTGLTLRENHLKTIVGGRLLESQACFFANRAALKANPELLNLVRQMLERFEAHLRAKGHYNVIANIRGESAEAVAAKLHRYPTLSGLRGPTLSPVYPQEPGEDRWFALSLVVGKETLQQAIQELRSVGGSGVVVLPALFIFEEVPQRWQALQQALEL